jgi:glycosyltransferase involved in cell wall biosynthesis
MAAVYSASDVVVSASSSEGLPNAVAEAMSCERACVVTDVGDSAWLVGAAGIVAGCQSSPALARAMAEAEALGAEGRAALGKLGRQRVIENLPVEAMIAGTHELMVPLAR